MVTRAIQPAIDADALKALQDEFTDRAIAVRELMAGTFDEQINALNALKADVAERQGIINTVEKAAAVKSDADSYAKSVKAAADQANKVAADLLAEANAAMQDATDKEKQVEAREEQALAMMADCDKRQADMDKRASALEADLEAREDVLTKGLADLETARADLAKRKAAFDAQVAAVQSITA